MKNRSYYKNGEYIDVTTGRSYQPKYTCEICGSRIALSVHHFLKQQKCMRDMKSKIKAPYIWTKEFIEKHQKLFTLCLNCHHDVDFMEDGLFFEKYGIKRSEFVYEQI